MKRSIIAVCSATIALAGCAPSAPPPAAAGTVPANFSAVGLERVMGQDAAGLMRLFGQPDADTREGPGRRLQFAGRFCVLDAYLYPRGQNGGEAHVTWVDAREPDGSGIDRASCVAALTRRDGGR
jgi:hypothetical protein